MNVFAITFLLAATACFVSISSGLSCIRCGTYPCPDFDPGACRNGVSRDVCACCDVCSKGPGDQCGGMWRIHGKCGDDLECHNEDTSEWASQMPGTCVAKT